MRVINLKFCFVLVFLGWSSKILVSADSNDTQVFIKIFKAKLVSSITTYMCMGDNTIEKHKMASTFNQMHMQLSIVDLPTNNYHKDYIQYRHEGVLVDTSCDGVTALITEASRKFWFKDINCWVFYQQLPCPENYNDTREISQLGFEMLSVAEMWVDSQVMWVQKTCNNEYAFFDTYRVSKYFKVNSTVFGVYPRRPIWRIIQNLEPHGKRRKNLQQTPMLGAAAILSPKEFTNMSDFQTRNFDAFTKWNYPLCMTLIEDLNININVTIFTNFGTDQNGTGIYDGLIGCFQSGECDIGFGAILMTERWIPISDVIAQPLQVKVRFIFRKPMLSTLSNIFILPFDLDVWLCCGVVFLLITLAFLLQIWLDKKNHSEEEEMSFIDAFTFITGAICQQGSSLEPKTLSTKVSIFLVFTASLFLYTSYSANIVNLLQTPSKSIRTVKDLVESPLQIAAQNVSYNHEYLENSKYPIIRRLYEEKMVGQPDNGFMHPNDGMRHVKEGLFAFQVDMAFAYNYMSYKYTDNEKCEITEIEALRLPVTCLPAPKNSPYRDLFTQRIKWQREVGLLDKTKRFWAPQKPVCSMHRSGYVSVGLVELMPAIRVVAYGTICSIVIFILELLVDLKNRKWSNKKQRRVLDKLLGENPIKHNNYWKIS